LAWLYVRSGTTPAGAAMLYGIKPVIIAVILQALFGLGRTAIKDVIAAAGAGAACGLYLLGVNPLFVLFSIGLGVMALKAGPRLLKARPALILTWPHVSGLVLGLKSGATELGAPTALGDRSAVMTATGAAVATTTGGFSY